MNRTNLVGACLILGAAIGFSLGLILTDAGMAAVYGAVGGGLGIVLGAVVGSLWREPT